MIRIIQWETNLLIPWRRRRSIIQETDLNYQRKNIKYVCLYVIYINYDNNIYEKQAGIIENNRTGIESMISLYKVATNYITSDKIINKHTAL